MLYSSSASKYYSASNFVKYEADKALGLERKWIFKNPFSKILKIQYSFFECYLQLIPVRKTYSI